MGTVFVELSSWTALTRHTGKNTTFRPNILKQICSYNYHDDFNSSKHYTKIHTNTTVGLKFSSVTFSI